MKHELGEITRWNGQITGAECSCGFDLRPLLPHYPCEDTVRRAVSYHRWVMEGMG
jgi:hypothetical protein